MDFCRRITTMLVLVFLVIGLGACGGNSVETEPNDSIDQAESLPLDTPFQTKIQEKNDSDWFKVELEDRGYLRVKAENVPEKLGLRVRFALKEEWKGNKVKPIRDWNELPESARIPEKGTYYLEIGDDYSDAKSKQEFKITADFLEEFDSTEINDKPEQATEVSPGKVVKPAIYPIGDPDWFKVTAPGRGYLTAKESDVPEGINPQIQWTKYDEWSKPKVKKLRGWNDLPDAMFVPEKDTYHVHIGDDYGDGQSKSNYKLKIGYMKPMDPHEPNDNPDQAGEIQLGKTLTVALFPLKDNDYFFFQSKKDGALKIRVSGAEGVVPEVALYYKLDNGEWSDGSDWKKPPTSFEVKSNRTYMLRLHDDYGDQRSPKPFKLKTELE